MHRHSIVFLALFFFTIAWCGSQAHSQAAEDEIVLSYKPEENLNYLADRTFTRLKRHKGNETRTLRERAVIRYGKPEPLKGGEIRSTPEMTLLSIEGDMERRGIYRLETLAPLARKYPTGRLTRFVDSDSARGRPWDVLRVFRTFGVFPVFLETPLALGQEWRSEMDMRYSGGLKYLSPVTIRHQLVRIEMIEGRRCALIKYTFSGALQTAKHPEMLETKMAEQTKPEYTLVGHGTVYFDVDRGMIVSKEQRVEWTKAWAGKLAPSLVRQHSNWEVAVDQVTSSSITTRLISDDEASRLIKEAEEAKAKTAAEPEQPPAPKWTYYVNRTAT